MLFQDLSFSLTFENRFSSYRAQSREELKLFGVSPFLPIAWRYLKAFRQFLDDHWFYRFLFVFLFQIYEIKEERYIALKEIS